MTMYDEGALRDALRGAANEFTVSDSATQQILDQARDSSASTKSRKVEGLYLRFGRMQSIAVAVAASVVLFAVAVPLFLSEQPGAPSIFHGADGKIEVHGESAPLLPRSLSPGDEGLVVVTGTGASYVANNSVTTNSKTSATTGGSLRVEEIGTIDLTIGASRFQTTLTQLTAFATSDGGYVSSTRAHMGTKKSGTFSSGSIVLEVPEQRFAMLVDQVRHVGHATSVVTTASDVTGQYVDLQARISALQLSRAQYLKIMTRTNSIGGILSVQMQLNNIQSQIEQLQSQLGLLTTETTYGSLTVSLKQSGQVTIPAQRPRTGFNKAWHDSITGFVSGFEWLLRIAGPLLFALILLSALLIVARLIWRAGERRRN